MVNDKIKPLISVILPVYNVEKYLRRCMESVLTQSYQNLDIILVDDGSNDNSGKLCDQYALCDHRVKVIHKSNGGLSDARNFGIEKAKGEYITFIDSDDSVDKDMISYLYGLIQRSQCSISLCAHRIIWENKNNKCRELGNGEEEILSVENCIHKMLYHNQVDTSAWGKLYQRSLFNTIRYPKGRLFEDIGTTYKLFLASDYIACGYKGKYNYYIRDDSITTKPFSLSKLDLLDMTDEMADAVKSKYPQLKQAVLRRQVYARFSTLNQMLNINNKFVSKRNQIISFIKNHIWSILLDGEAPIRDKIAICALLGGFSFYKNSWSFYEKYLWKY